MRRVAVTGLGAVSALGVGVAVFWDRVVAGASGVRRITNFDAAGFVAQVAAEVPGYTPAQYFTDAEQSLLDRFAQFAVIAAGEACAQAGLTLTDAECDRAGVTIGSAMGGAVTQDQGYKALYGEGRPRRTSACATACAARRCRSARRAPRLRTQSARPPR